MKATTGLSCPHERVADPFQAATKAASEADRWRLRHASLCKFTIVSVSLNALLFCGLLTAVTALIHR